MGFGCYLVFGLGVLDFEVLFDVCARRLYVFVLVYMPGCFLLGLRGFNLVLCCYFVFLNIFCLGLWTDTIFDG